MKEVNKYSDSIELCLMVPMLNKTTGGLEIRSGQNCF